MLDEIVATGCFQTKTYDLASDLLGMSEPAHIERRFLRFTEDMGFKGVLCVSIPRKGESLGLNVMLCTLPKKWIGYYSDQDYVHVDPRVKAGLNKCSPFTWDDERDGHNGDPKVRALISERAELGISHAVIVPIMRSHARTDIVSISGEHAARANEFVSLAMSAILLHSRLTALSEQAKQPAAVINGKEIECLRWAAEGKTDWEIGTILGFNNKTVNYHIENAKRKMGASTRMQAVVCLLKHGLLD